MARDTEEIIKKVEDFRKSMVHEHTVSVEAIILASQFVHQAALIYEVVGGKQLAEAQLLSAARNLNKDEQDV